LSGGQDMKALLWEVRPVTRVVRIEKENHDLTSTGVSSDGTFIIAGREDGTAAVWDMRTGELLWTIQAGTYRVVGGGFTLDNKLLVTLSDRVRVWDMRDGTLLYEFKQIGDYNTIAYLDVSSDYILSTHDDSTTGQIGEVVAWNIRTGDMVRRFPLSDLQFAVISLDQKSVYAYTSLNHTFTEFDMATGKQLRTFQHVLPVNTFRPAFSPTDSILFAGGDMTGALLNLDNGAPLHNIVGHRDLVQSGAFSHNGRFIVTSSLDGTVRIWESKTGREVRRITLPFDPDFAAFSANDDLLVVRGSGKIYIFYADVNQTLNDLCSRLLRDLTPDERIQYELPDTEPTCPQFAAGTSGQRK
jgi:WD40 repeat protein